MNRFKMNCKVWTLEDGGKQNLYLKATKNRDGNFSAKSSYSHELNNQSGRWLNFHNMNISKMLEGCCGRLKYLLRLSSLCGRFTTLFQAIVPSSRFR